MYREREEEREKQRENSEKTTFFFIFFVQPKITMKKCPGTRAQGCGALVPWYHGLTDNGTYVHVFKGLTTTPPTSTSSKTWYHGLTDNTTYVHVFQDLTEFSFSYFTNLTTLSHK